MKRIFALLFVLVLAVGARAQTFGTILLNNNSNSLVTNGITGALANSNMPIRVQLYVAPDGTMDEAAFTAVTSSIPVGLSQALAGRYTGNTRAVPPWSPGTPIMIQMRAWEYAYGTSYEAALVAAPMNGRRAAVGVSQIARVVLGGGGPVSNATPSVSVVGPITVWPVGNDPLLFVDDVTVAEGSNGVATANFVVRLSGTIVDPVTVDFATQDASALAGSDYVASSGTLTFQPGEITKTVPITITADEPPEDVEQFGFRLSNAVNATIIRPFAICTIVEIRIQALRVDTSVTFNTLSGRRYLLEKTMDLVNWIPVAGATNIVGTSTNVTVIDRGSGCQSMTVYRASLLP